MIEARDEKRKRLDLSDFIPVKMHPQKLGRIREDARAWCSSHISDGKFTLRWNTLSWYFEKEEDAIIFSLKWL